MIFKPVFLYVGLRYIRAKRRNHFISFISTASILGIMLGILVLITVLSVMNGFDSEIKKRIFGLTPQVTITSENESLLTSWKSLGEKLIKLKDVEAFAPFVEGQGMLTEGDMTQPILVQGIKPSLEGGITNLKDHFVEGSFDALKPGEFGIILGDDLAHHLGLSLGDKINLLTAKGTISPAGLLPTTKRFILVGTFHVGGGFSQLDSGLGYIHLNDAQAVYEKGNTISGIHLRIKGLYDALKVSYDVDQLLGPNYQVRNWTEKYGAYFDVIRMEKTIMFVLLLFIVAVAVFNLVSTLVMVVTDKRAEIAILKTLGATPGTIMLTFIVQGTFIGVIGVILGALGGILLSLNITQIVRKLEQWFNTQFVPSSFYYTDYLPSKLILSDVITVSLSAFILTLLATLYPAWQASKVQPAEALRYE